MELSDFREKLVELHEKSGMDSFLDWPFVYDEDEVGDVYIAGDGVFHLENRSHDWEPISLNVRDVSYMRYEVDYEEPGIEHNKDAEPEYSCIFIYFTHGAEIRLLNRHDSYTVRTTITLNELLGEDEKRVYLNFIAAKPDAEVYIGAERLKADDMKQLSQEGDNEEGWIHSDERDGEVSDEQRVAWAEIVLRIWELNELVEEGEIEGGLEEAWRNIVESGENAATLEIGGENAAIAIYNAMQSFKDDFATAKGIDVHRLTEPTVALIVEGWLRDHGMLEEYGISEDQGEGAAEDAVDY